MAKCSNSFTGFFFLRDTLLFLILTLCVFSGTKAQEVEDEREFSYEVGTENGPDRWGAIHSEWALCSNGTMQSPIDLDSERVKVVPAVGRLRRSYKPARTVLKNRGHDIMLEWTEDAGALHIGGTEYHLKQCHWHSPSEHTLHGRRFDMEVHLVHQSSENKTAVLGIMYKRGSPDNFLSKLMKPIAEIVETKELEKGLGVVNPRDIKLGSRKYYRYLGSLTTPPCHEGVIWTITRKVRTVSMEQMRLLRDAVHDGAERNVRPRQHINDRYIQFYRPHDGRPRR